MIADHAAPAVDISDYTSKYQLTGVQEGLLFFLFWWLSLLL